MSQPDADLTAALANAVRAGRKARALSTAELARRSGVSRAMIAKVERGDAQPTAALLGRLSGALGLTLSELIARAEAAPGRIARAAGQPVWRDPETGYTRTAVSPPGAALQLVQVELPARARVPYPADTYAFVDHLIWVQAGHLRFHEGPEVHDLHAGDCLALGPPQDCAYENPGRAACRYVVALARRP